MAGILQIRSLQTRYSGSRIMLINDSEDATGVQRLLDVATVLDPRSLPAHRNLGLILLEAQAPALAIQHLTLAAEVEPNNPLTFLRLARAHEMMGDWHLALRAYSRVHAITGELDWVAHLEAGDRLADLKQWDAAFREYQRAVGLLAGSKPIVYERFYRVLVRHLAEEVSQDSSHTISRYLLGKYLVRVGELGAALREFESILGESAQGLRRSQLGRVHYYLGMGSETNAQTELAIQHYEMAIELDHVVLDAYGRLAALYQMSNMTSSLIELQAKLDELEPDLVVDTEVDEGWTLVGYSIDEDDLELGAPVEALFFWDNPTVTTSPGPNWHRGGKWWVESKRTINLIPDAGFEWMLDEDGYPLGYFEAPYPPRLEKDRIVTSTPRGGWTTNCALLDNREYPGTGLTSIRIPIEAGPYLLASWLKTEEAAKGFLGYQWQGGLSLEGEDDIYGYVAAQVNPESWSHYARVVTPPRGTTGVNVRLLSHGSGGRVCFDNIVLVQLRPPSNGLQ